MNSSQDTEQEEAHESLLLEAGLAEHQQRLDKAVAMLAPEFSRTRLKALIDAGECSLNGKIVTTASRKVEFGDKIIIAIPPVEDALPEPENIPLDIVYEDEDVIVLNKAAGMVVHPAVGHSHGTLVHALLGHCGDSLSGINGVRRPGIVHRLDKDTSGLMIVAKTDHAHHHLAEQLQDRSLHRVYHALVVGVPSPIKGQVETLIGRHPSNRLKMAVVGWNGKAALTYFQALEQFKKTLCLVECQLESGRTHQIRVHMDHIGHPLVGDPLYGPQLPALRSKLRKADFDDSVIEQVMVFPRQALHAVEISFLHPRNDEEMTFSAPYPEDFSDLLASCREKLS
jgi:23S rRNA pseudouridine1911/1915/1917 synthase